MSYETPKAPRVTAHALLFSLLRTMLIAIFCGGIATQSGLATGRLLPPKIIRKGPIQFPSSLQFGTQLVGTASTPQTITLGNNALTPLEISKIALTGTDPADFAETNNCGTSVAASQTCTITVTFEPVGAGQRAAVLSVTSTAIGGVQTVSLSGTGAAAPSASFSTSSLAFGSEAIGNTTTAQSITLSNPGSAALSVASITIAGVSINDFAQTNTCGNSVAAGGACTISVRFTPTASGARYANVTVTDNAAGSTQSVSLTGTGASVPGANLSTASLTFGNEPVNVASAAQVVTVNNVGSAALSITSIAFTGANATDFTQTNTCNSSVAAGTQCTISIMFTPATAGAATASLAVADNASGSPQMVSLSGTGAAAAASLSPSSLSFPSQLVGSSAVPQSVTLTNSGNAALNVTGLTVSGANAGSFTQTNNCGASLAAGSSCTIVVIFAPSTSGLLAATLTVSDNASGSPQTVGLSGTGSAVSANGSTEALAFGSLPTGTVSPAQTVVLSNTGTAALSITGIVIAGANAGSFGASNNCGSSLPAGANCTITVSFSPAATGNLSAVLSVTDNATTGPQTVSLTGTGTTTAPGQTVSVVPTDNLQTLVNEYPGSTTFSLAPGMYRLQTVTPQSGDSFVGETGAIMSGAALLTNFVQSGSYWTAQVSVSQQASYPGSCLSTSPVCMYPEDLFFNNVLKTRVASVADVAPGTWYLDYTTQTAYIGDDPSGQNRGTQRTALRLRRWRVGCNDQQSGG